MSCDSPTMLHSTWIIQSYCLVAFGVETNLKILYVVDSYFLPQFHLEIERMRVITLLHKLKNEIKKCHWPFYDFLTRIGLIIMISVYFIISVWQVFLQNVTTYLLIILSDTYLFIVLFSSKYKSSYSLVIVHSFWRKCCICHFFCSHNKEVWDVRFAHEVW